MIENLEEGEDLQSLEPGRRVYRKVITTINPIIVKPVRAIKTSTATIDLVLIIIPHLTRNCISNGHANKRRSGEKPGCNTEITR